MTLIGGQIVAKWTPDNQVSITETISNRRRKKQLYVSHVRRSPDSKKVEYQLRETEEDAGVYYMNGKWFSDEEVRQP